MKIEYQNWSVFCLIDTQRRLPLFQGLPPFNKSTLSGDIMGGWSPLSTRRRAATDFRVDDPAFGDQRLRSFSPAATARWRRNPKELIER
jgi:hypothetical protein